MGDNDMILEAVHDLLVFSLQLRKLRKHQLGDRLMKAVRSVIASNWVPYLQNEVCRITQHVRKGRGRKEGKDLS